jgi:membrane protein DedA with SNARE-associated domain
MQELFKPLFDWYAASLESGGYLMVVLLMAMESTFVPLPSELIIPPAMIVGQRAGNMSLVGIVIAGTLGSWLGATAMYWASRWAGRPLVIRYGKYFFIPEGKVVQAERWAAQFGGFGIFASRLLPVVRHLIGIPAGIVRLSYIKFALFTVIGSGLWCTVLCWVGLKARNDPALMAGEMHQVALWLAGGLAILGVLYYFLVHRFARPDGQAGPRA